MLFIYLSIAWVFGILLAYNIHEYELSAWLIPFGLLPLILLIPFRKWKKLIITASVCIIVFTGGMVRAQSNLSETLYNVMPLLVQYNDTVTLRGTITTAPDVRDSSTRLTIAVTEIQTNDGWYTVSTKVLVFVPRYPDYKYGDFLQVTGAPETPPALGDFDYKGYLAGQGIYSVMSYPRVEVLEHGRGFKPLGWVYTVRQALAEKLARVLPEPQASLAQGIVLGIRTNIPPSVNDDFIRTGTAHILAISGQNLSIVTGLFIAAGLWLFGKKRYLYVWLALVATWGYALLTGMSAPVVRSAIMLSLFLCADLLGRQRSALPALAFAAAIMVAFTPRLPWDVSFQLSFLSMLGLVLVAPPLQSYGRDFITERLGEEGILVRSLNWLTDSLAVTIGVILVIWPVLAHYFGVFSIVAPLANLLILPALPAILVTGALAAVAGVIALPVGQVIGWLTWLFTSYLLAVTHWLAQLPVASVTTGGLNPFVFWGYFTALALGLWFYHLRKRLSAVIGRISDFLAAPSKRLAIPALGILAILSILFAGSMPDNRTHVSFLDIGQGDSILIQTGSQDILVDGGPRPMTAIQELGRRLPFWDRTIELVVLTHPHADHLAGLIEVLKRYHVQRVLYAETTSTSPLWTEWLDLVRSRKISVTIAKAGQVIDTGEGNPSIEVLSAGGGDEASLDSGGIVLRVQEGKISFLLTADVTQGTELNLLTERAHLDSTVLKVAHHGSYTATSTEFLSVVTPQVAVISVGADNDYGHPSKEVMTRLSNTPGTEHVYRTDLNGTIEFITDGKKIWVKTGK